VSCGAAIATHAVFSRFEKQFRSNRNTHKCKHFYYAEIHFPTIETLQACAESESGKQTIANAVAICSGGAPIFLVAEEETVVFIGD
jgi:hypothetical protein